MPSNESLAIFKNVAKFSSLREAINRPESRQLAKKILIEMTAFVEDFKKNQKLSPLELSSLLKKEIGLIEYPLQELKQYFTDPTQSRLKEKNVILLIDFLDYISNDLITNPFFSLNEESPK